MEASPQLFFHGSLIHGEKHQRILVHERNKGYGFCHNDQIGLATRETGGGGDAGVVLFLEEGFHRIQGICIRACKDLIQSLRGDIHLAEQGRIRCLEPNAHFVLIIGVAIDSVVGFISFIGGTVCSGGIADGTVLADFDGRFGHIIHLLMEPLHTFGQVLVNDLLVHFGVTLGGLTQHYQLQNDQWHAAQTCNCKEQLHEVIFLLKKVLYLQGISSAIFLFIIPKSVFCRQRSQDNVHPLKIVSYSNESRRC